MTIPLAGKPNASSWKPISTALTSETSSHPDNTLNTPDFTPADTPPIGQRATDFELLDKIARMDEAAEMNNTKVDGTATEESQIQPPISKEEKTPPAAKKPCKKHVSSKDNLKKSKRSKSKKDALADSDSSSSSSSSESDESESSDSSSEDQDEKSKRKIKLKAKKLKEKKAALKKAKGKKKQKKADSSDESDSSLDSSSDEEEKRRAKKRKAKARARKVAEEAAEEEEQVDDDDANARAQLAQLQALNLRRNIAGSRRIGRIPVDIIPKTTDTKSAKKKVDPSNPDYFRVDQLWDKTIHNYKLTETADRSNEDEFGEYIFHVRRRFDWEGKYSDTVVDIKSKVLKDALVHVMGSCKGVSLAEETPTIDPNMLFLYLEELRNYQKELKAQSKLEQKKKKRKAATIQAATVKVLVKYLDNDYAETKKTLYPLLKEGRITFDLLWALFKSGEIAYCPVYSTPDLPRAFKVEYATKESSFMKGTWYEIEGKYLEYDGKSFGMGTMEVEVEAFKNARPINSLPCYPIKYHKDPETLRKTLVDRGRKFVGLKGMQYKFHKGLAFYKKRRQVVKVNINGRVMIDSKNFRRINPNYPISTVKAEDPDLLPEEERDSDEESCGCGEDEDAQATGQNFEDAEKPRIRMKLVTDDRDHAAIVEVEVDENGMEIQKEKIDELPTEDESPERTFTDEELLIASPVVLGFAFSEKLWLEFIVSGINEIEWNEGAFESLVLPEDQKSIVKALVESHSFQGKKNIDDVIQGKGRGLVAVLHGNPGTGKTLTAESISELLKCPLYMVSAGELGTNPRELEAELQKVLDIAHSWGAILLLDEADVFLEKRTVQDIHRNALVSIFLRLLEYFQGILFLTTNRVETFDDAFQSRIHVALRYTELTYKARKSIWIMFLQRVRELDGVKTVQFMDADYDRLAKTVLNGRQIKNSVRTAQALAVNEGVELGMGHIQRVLDVAKNFEHDLRGGPGWEDSLRLYR
ncbi:hypothetical protein MMC26_001503 [Xylographa opegraphella]|nr:hypothetical protein [Xylographa opegraphella]